VCWHKTTIYDPLNTIALLKTRHQKQVEKYRVEESIRYLMSCSREGCCGDERPGEEAPLSGEDGCGGRCLQPTGCWLEDEV